MPRKFKVFQAQIGFHDMIVAAPSQAAALRALGTTRNLFADGVARLATDERAMEAALAQPEVVLKRAIGTSDPFGLNPGLPRIPDLPAASRKGKAGKPELRVVPKPPPPDRSALDGAEAALAKLNAAWRDDDARLRERRAALEAEERSACAAHDEAQRAAEQVVERARTAYLAAGGTLSPKR